MKEMNSKLTVLAIAAAVIASFAAAQQMAPTPQAAQAFPFWGFHHFGFFHHGWGWGFHHPFWGGWGGYGYPGWGGSWWGGSGNGCGWDGW